MEGTTVDPEGIPNDLIIVSIILVLNGALLIKSVSLLQFIKIVNII